MLREVLHVVPREGAQVHQPQRVHPRRGQGLLLLLLRDPRHQASHHEHGADRRHQHRRRLPHLPRQDRRHRHLRHPRVPHVRHGPVHRPG